MGQNRLVAELENPNFAVKLLILCDYETKKKDGERYKAGKDKMMIAQVFNQSTKSDQQWVKCRYVKIGMETRSTTITCGRKLCGNK